MPNCLRTCAFMVDKSNYIQKFKELHKGKTGQELSDSEALRFFEELIALVAAIYAPIPKPIHE